MKNIQIILLLVFSIFSFQISAQKVKNQKETFEVSGNCDMCKSKIETAAKSVEGVKTARWNVINGNMKVKFNPEITNLNEIQKSIALIGYDTEIYRAEDEVYEKLNYCCKYARKPEK